MVAYVTRRHTITTKPASTASVVANLPTWSTGDLVLIAVSGKDQTTTTIEAPSGWTRIAWNTGGTGTLGMDEGQVFTGIYARIMAYGDSSPTFIAGSTAPNSWVVVASSFVPTDGTPHSLSALAVKYVSDSVTTTPLTGDTPTLSPVVSGGDLLWMVAATPTDAATSHSLNWFTAPGLSGGTVTAEGYLEQNMGYDCTTSIAFWQNFTGTSSGGASVSISPSAGNASGLISVVSIGRIKYVDVAVVVEQFVIEPFDTSKDVPLPLLVEDNTAGTTTWLWATDLANPINVFTYPTPPPNVFPAYEVNNPLGQFVKHSTLEMGLLTTTDEAIAITPIKTVSGDTEINTALTVVREKSYPVTKAVETDELIAMIAMSFRGAWALQGIEVDEALPVIAIKDRTLPLLTETDTTPMIVAAWRDITIEITDVHLDYTGALVTALRWTGGAPDTEWDGELPSPHWQMTKPEL